MVSRNRNSRATTLAPPDGNPAEPDAHYPRRADHRGRCPTELAGRLGGGDGLRLAMPVSSQRLPSGPRPLTSGGSSGPTSTRLWYRDVRDLTTAMLGDPMASSGSRCSMPAAVGN